jgi:diadenosine tetraphosphate (Ap4A) HIT family hydrolase
MTPAERLQELVEGKNPRIVMKMRSGFAVMADNQFLPGYCLLLAYPQVSQLTDLDEKGRVLFLEDMATLGEAIAMVTECKRTNFAMYGNVDPFLHAHVWPRYEWEIDEFATVPPLSYPEEIRSHEDTEWDPALHAETQDQIRRTLLHLLEHRGHIEVLP